MGSTIIQQMGEMKLKDSSDIGLAMVTDDVEEQVNVRLFGLSLFDDNLLFRVYKKRASFFYRLDIETEAKVIFHQEQI